MVWHFIKMIKRGATISDILNRIGIYGNKLKKVSKSQPIWIHAVSVGEVKIAIKLIEQILLSNPKVKFVLSITTPTGKRVGESANLQSTTIIHNPIDFLPITFFVINKIKPRCILLIEAEIWPNLMFISKLKKIPVALINARLSTRSEKRYHSFVFIIRPIFELLDMVTVTSDEELPRWENLGVNADKLQVTANIKYDDLGGVPKVEIDKMSNILSQVCEPDTKQIILLGSSHNREELYIGEIFKELQKDLENLFLIVVPRHFERAEKVTEEFDRIGLDYVLRSKISNIELSCGDTENYKNKNALIVDTTGELSAWYYLANVVIIGKSFLSTGGQNPIEPVVAKKPIIFGEHMENFLAVVNPLLNYSGAVQVESKNELKESLIKILTNKDYAEELVENSQQLLNYHAGATKNTVKVLTDLKII